jgi:acetyl esterase/lipase
MILGLSHFGVSLSHASQLRQQWNSRTLARRTMRDAGVRNTPALDSRSVVKEASVMLFPLNSNPSLGGGSLRITEGVTYASVDDVRLRLNVYALKNRAKNPFLKKVEKKAAAHGGSEDNKMNYHRTSFGSYDDNFKSGGGAPVILFIHGGGWVRGDRGSHALPWIYEMASSGWVVVSCSYRKAPAFRFPAALRDVKKAMQWTRNNIHLYDGNPNFVVAAGDSAGGHLALLLTLTPNDPSLQDSDVDTSVRACLDMYGIRDFADEHRHFDELYGPDYAVFLQRIVMGRRIGETNQHLLEALSPLHILRKRIADGADNVPPIMLIHGDLDAMVPVDDARVFYDSLTKLRAHSTNAKDVYLEFPQSHHGFNFLLSPRTLTMHDALRDFANHVYDSHLHENSKSEALPEGHKVSLSSSL